MEVQPVYNSYNLFKIPQFEIEGTNKNKNFIVGLIDASGSMGSYWASMVKFWNEKIAPQADVLITFSGTAKIQQTTYLNQSLKFHGGGMTNILDAFKKLEEKVQTLDKKMTITIVFISDGDDTVNGQQKLVQQMIKLKGGNGRNITFLCLGIQKGFPTKIAMNLRELYHTGDQKIPAIYLIEYASEKAFFNKFETMSNCFKSSNLTQIDEIYKNYIKQYPWQKDGFVNFKQGKWIMVHKQFSQIQVLYNETEKKKFFIPPLKDLPLDELVDCFRGWVQKVQLESMDNSKIQETKKIASLTEEVMKKYTLDYEICCNISIITEKKEIKELFRDRAMGLAVKNTGSRIKWYLDQLAIIAKGVGIGQLNEYEAAKRIGLGTITGKYHQKALALKGITVKDFLEIKQQFAEIFKKTKLSQKPSLQQCSIFTLQNQKEVFEQPDFLVGLQYCKSQYDLVETFPVVGYGLKVKRYDGSMINPWKVRLQALAKTHKSIDSMYLAKNSNKYQLSIGDDEKEQINAVLPLFDIGDGQMSQLFNSRLFKLAVSFMVVQNIDTYHQQAYLALLGTTYTFLLKQPESEWRNNLIDLIYTSLKVTYGATKQFQKFIEQVQQNPYKLWQNKGKQDHVDIVKIMILIFYISRENRISEQKLNQLVDLALVHYCEKTYVENEFKIFRVADLKVDKILSEKKQNQNIINQQMKEESDLGPINTFKNYDQLKLKAQQKMKDLINLAGINIKLNDKIFLQEQQDRRVTYSMIQNFYKMLTKNELNSKDKQILYYFGHYLKGANKQNYSKPIIKDMKDVEKQILIKMDINNLKNQQGKQFKKLRKIVEQKYIDHFRATHFGIIPISIDQLKSKCIQKKLSFNHLQINQSTKMIRNACMSPHCQFYLQPMKKAELIDHLRLWKGSLPARFHLTVSNYLKQKKNPKQICELLFKSNLVNLQKHKKNEDFVINYIRQIRDAPV